MRYLFVVAHPAHVHLFKNVIRSLQDEGNRVLVGAIPREVTIHLLQTYQIPHFVLGKLRSTLVTKALDLLPKDLLLLLRSRDFNPEVVISTGSPYGAHVSAVLSRPHLVFGDTETAALTARITLPFSDCVCTPEAFHGNLGFKHVRYNGYKELAYLHPKYFQPDPSVLDEVGLSRSEHFVIVRVASRDASHSVGLHGVGFGVGQSKSFFEGLSSRVRVVVTSDGQVPSDLQQYVVSVRPERMHDLLAFAAMYIGEGATMAAEAGVLGVPWIFLSSSGRGFLDEQQRRYGLGRWTNSLSVASDQAAEWLSRKDLKEVWRNKRRVMLEEKEDVTRFILDFIRGWPRSFFAAKRTRPSNLDASKATG